MTSCYFSVAQATTKLERQSLGESNSESNFPKKGERWKSGASDKASHWQMSGGKRRKVTGKGIAEKRKGETKEMKHSFA